MLKARFLDFPRRERTGDPKPSELAMVRVNVVEERQEARTRESFNALG